MLRKSARLRYQFIHDNRQHYPLIWWLDCLEVSRSGYHSWQHKPPSERSKQDKQLLQKIRHVYLDSRKTYGYPRIHAELKAAGETCGRHRIYRLMKANGIQALMARKQKRSREAKHREGFAANTLNRRFYAFAPNQRWVTDMTTIPIRGGYLHLAAVLDLYSRALIGWAMDTRMTTELIKDALTMALWRRGKPRYVLVHSDQGSQYRSMDYQKLLTDNALECSMSRKGNCHDNAVMESFFHTLKTELTNHHRYQSVQAAKQSIFEYIEIFYNTRRRHSYLNYTAPFEYESMMENEK